MPKWENNLINMTYALISMWKMEPYKYEIKNCASPVINYTMACRQWSWQYCTEYGYFQTPSHNHRTRSTAIDVEYFRNTCRRVFNNKISGIPDTEKFNKEWANFSGKNILLVTQSDDPWKWAGLQEITDKEKQKDLRLLHVKCTDCGHCSDLRGGITAKDTTNLKIAKLQAMHIISDWLVKDR